MTPNVAKLLAMVFCAGGVFAQSPTPQQLFQNAVAAQERGDDAGAVRLYKEILQADPGASVVRLNLGASLAHLKRFDEAIGQYRLVLLADPSNNPVRLNLALAYEGKSDFRAALKELELLHKREPRNAQAAILLGDCYGRLGRYPEAVTLLRPLEPEHPEDPELAWLLGSAMIHSGETEEGLKRIDRVAAASGSAEAYLLAGRTRLELAQYAAARKNAEAAHRLDPALPGLRTLDGMILEQSGDYDGAENALREALQADPQDFDANYYLGSVLYFRRDMKEARKYLENATRIRPKSSRARYELALVARAGGNLDEALDQLQNVVLLEPNWLQPHIELSSLYYALKRPEDGAEERHIVDRLTAEQPAAP